VVSTHLNNISQIGNLPQIGVKKKYLKPPARLPIGTSSLRVFQVKVHGSDLEFCSAEIHPKLATNPGRKNWKMQVFGRICMITHSAISAISHQNIKKFKLHSIMNTPKD